MKIPLPNNLLSLLLLLLLATGSAAAAPSVASATAGEEGEEVVIPRVNCRAGEVSRLFWLVEKETGVRFDLQLTKEQADRLPRFRMDLQAMPAAALVQLICEEAKLEYRMEDGGFSFYPAGTLRPPGTKPKPKSKPKTTGPGIGGTSVGIGTVYYYPVGYTKPRVAVMPGAVAVVGPVPIFRRGYSGVSVTSPMTPAPAAPPPQAPAAPPPRPDDVATLRRLDAVTLPAMHWENADLETVLAGVRKTLREQSPDRRCVNLYVSLRAEPAAALNVAWPTGTTLGTALQQIGDAGNLAFRAERWGVIFF